MNIRTWGGKAGHNTCLEIQRQRSKLHPGLIDSYQPLIEYNVEMGVAHHHPMI